jgi:hypothetical protein
MWTELLNAHVDWINTDHPIEVNQFLTLHQR